MPTISLIAAMTNNERVIGINNTLPWHLPADLAHFRQLTQHKPIIMGRRTFESISKALPKRRNLIITRQKNYTAEHCEIFTDINSAINACNDADEVMVIGGAQIYKQTLPIANRLYLTLVEMNVKGDTFFPKWSQDEWHELSRETHHDPCTYHFVTLERCCQPGT